MTDKICIRYKRNKRHISMFEEEIPDAVSACYVNQGGSEFLKVRKSNGDTEYRPRCDIAAWWKVGDGVPAKD
jgi:hypothetical protein